MITVGTVVNPDTENVDDADGISFEKGQAQDRETQHEVGSSLYGSALQWK